MVKEYVNIPTNL